MAKNPWIKDTVGAGSRAWEEFYRNRWQHDKIVRSTHGVNCTGGCTWQVYVKDGIVTWEMQGLDYPEIDPKLPPYEPRGCQRGISYSWYLYSPLRVKYPYIRGALIDLWRKARAKHDDPVEAWKSLTEDPQARARWQRARGKGGFRRGSWDDMLEIIAASCISTIKEHGPDRIAGFSPIPAMSMISYAAGARMLQLMGGISLSFYDWYCDLPPASPEAWGEQTDVNESADWFNAKLLAVMGSNLNMTRTPDCHFAAEARHNGTKMYVFSPDFNQVAKYADTWLNVNAGQDGAWWMAVNHVILKEFHHERPVPAFIEYTKQFTDAPHLVELVASDGDLKPGQMLRANRLERYEDVENGEWKFLFWDAAENRPKCPCGSVGSRWAEKEKGKWNLELKDCTDDSRIDPALTFLGIEDGTEAVLLDDFAEGRALRRQVPVKRLTTADGSQVTVTTVYDLLMAQYGVPRGLGGEYPAGYDDADAPYTPAWQEKYTGLGRKDLLQFAREWASTAEHTDGKCTIIIGAGINHWYHGNLMYRAGIHALMFCGCVGKNGGGLAHYVGQEKLAPAEPWGAIAFGKDWIPASRLQNAPSWHYVNTDQWRYEKSFTDYHTVPPNQPPGSLASGHTIDAQIRAVRNGWLPFYPQFNQNSLDVVRDAEEAGDGDDESIVKRVVERLKSRDLRFSVEDPDAPENWPRVWFIWRGNALMSSSKGHEYFLRHYLGTHDNAIATEIAEDSVRDVEWHEKAPQGKMDLVVDLNFRMDTSALYSDIVLPAATWYEKSDLNSTDMHSFVHPLSEAVPPCWESKSDWDIFKAISEKFSELAERHFPDSVRDVVALPLAHDTPAEIAQPSMQDWHTGEVEAIPGKTMPALKVVTRNYKDLHKQYISLGPLVRENGLGAHGTHYKCEDYYDELVERRPVRWNGKAYPSIESDIDACNAVLALATVSNGELAYRSYKNMEEKVGRPLTHLAEKSQSVRMTYEDLQTRPHRYLSSPMWSGLIEYGRAYSPFTYNHDELVPWRTLTGRQHFYLDHPGYIQFGEHLPTYKPKPTPTEYADLRVSEEAGQSLMLNYLTPHGKWHIHSTYGDNQRMTTLSRGCEPFWINDKDAASIDIKDNDWVEVHNDHGVLLTRACVSVRIPRGICIVYHSPERTYGIPKSPLRGNRRGGGHNSVTRTRLKPNLMVGGYGQFTYHFNYWGPVGCNRDTHIYVRKLPETHLVDGEEDTLMDVRSQISMVFHLDKCIGCHTCSIACKNVWTDRKGTEYMWWNNVETKPGTGYPMQWENQDKYRGGWHKSNGDLRLRSTGKARVVANIFHNPSMPSLDDYYEPWTYDYQNLFNAPEGDDQPTARPISMIDGKHIDIESGPNWDDDLSGSPIYAENDPNLEALTAEQKAQMFAIERLVFFDFPRICNHCLNPACVASCPSGALYKRGEDGIVLIDQKVCRAWRSCVAACPYKKTYFNWQTGKSEKCILCFPRLETGQAPACFHSCVGRIRYLGVLLYDADRIEEIAKVPDAELVDAHRSIILDPRDPEVIQAARRSGVHDSVMESARNSPVYRFVKEWGIALPPHAEYRTLPMLFYVPPLLPVISSRDEKTTTTDSDEFFHDIEKARVPLEYLASLLGAGNVGKISYALRKQMAVRHYRRMLTVGDVDGEVVTRLLRAADCSPEEAEEIYRLTALCGADDRFVIPPAHREEAIEMMRDTLEHKQSVGFGFLSGPKRGL